MADVIITKQELIDAQKDAKTLEDVINGAADTQVTARMGRTFWTLATLNSKLNSVETAATQAIASIVSQKNQASAVISQAESDVVTAATDVHQRGNQEIVNLQNAIDIAAAAGAGENGWTAQLIVDGDKTQKQINDIVAEKTINLIDFLTESELASYREDYTSVDILDAWNRANFTANSLKQKLTAFGVFRSSSTLILYCDANLSCMTLESSSEGVALDVRDLNYDHLKFKVIELPQVVNLSKVPADNWVSTNATGIRLVNLDRCFVSVIRIQDFKVGLHEWATGGKGNCYNTIKIAQLNNNKINHYISADNTVASNGVSSWTNQNVHIGGSYSHFRNEGSLIADCHHLMLEACAFAINGHSFYGPSFENDACDFHVVNGGRYNKIDFARWEVQNGVPKVKYFCDSSLESVANHGTRNTINGGYDVERIAFAFEGTGSAFLNDLVSKDRIISNISSITGGARVKNAYSASEPYQTVYEPNVILESADKSEYNFSFESRRIAGKRGGDSFDRVVVDAYNGRIELGNGQSDTRVRLVGGPTSLFTNGNFVPLTSGAGSLGVSGNAWLDARFTGGIGMFGVAPPTSKPSVTGNKAPTTITEQNAIINSLVLVLERFGIVSDNRLD